MGSSTRLKVSPTSGRTGVGIQVCCWFQGRLTQTRSACLIIGSPDHIRLSSYRMPVVLAGWIGDADYTRRAYGRDSNSSGCTLEGGNHVGAGAGIGDAKHGGKIVDADTPVLQDVAHKTRAGGTCG